MLVISDLTEGVNVPVWMVVVWEGQRSLDPQRCIGYAVFEDRDSTADMQREAVCSVFYSFLGMQIEELNYLHAPFLQWLFFPLI